MLPLLFGVLVLEPSSCPPNCCVLGLFNLWVPGVLLSSVWDDFDCVGVRALSVLVLLICTATWCTLTPPDLSPYPPLVLHACIFIFKRIVFLHCTLGFIRIMADSFIVTITPHPPPPPLVLCARINVTNFMLSTNRMGGSCLVLFYLGTVRPRITAHIRFPQKYPDRRGNRIIEHTYCM